MKGGKVILFKAKRQTLQHSKLSHRPANYLELVGNRDVKVLMGSCFLSSLLALKLNEDLKKAYP